MTLPHLSTGTLVEEHHWNDHVDVINALGTEIGPTGIVQRAQSFRGLHLRTHPDADVAANKVKVTHVDEIVFDDGMRLTNLSNLVADLAVPGAGGLDTGTELASTGYDIYAIAKDDGTPNLLLHRSKQYTLDQSFSTTDNDGEALRVAANDRVKLAQSFTNGVAGPLVAADLQLLRVGAVVGRVWVSVQADSSGSPSGTPLAFSDKLDASLISSTTSQRIGFEFRSPATLNTSTTYWLVLEGDYAVSATIFIRWRGVTAGGYTGGLTKKFDATSWVTDSVLDFNFYTYITANDVAVTLPTGYTKKVRIGWVFNNSSGNFVAFVARDNFVETAPIPVVAGSSATVPTLVDLSQGIGALPPYPVVVTMIYSGSVAGDNIVIAGAPDGFQPFNPAMPYVTVAAPSNGGNMGLPPFPTELQRFYFYRAGGTGTVTLYVSSYRW